jgi:hypothetical protein
MEVIYVQIKNLFILSVVFASILLISCQTSRTGEPFVNSNQVELSKASIPYGAIIDSAAFYIKVNSTVNAEVTLHRITNDWQELMVTWNNFGGSFDTNVEGSFIASSADWYSVDVTALVNSWFDGTYSNYGMLLKEASPFATQFYSSRESGFGPYLKVWWTLNGTNGFDSTNAFADSYIQSDSGDVNFGNSLELATGWQDTIETQTLVNFEIELVYTRVLRSVLLKTHSIYGPAPYDTTWSLLGEDSTFFLSNQTNYQVMWTAPSGGNAYYMLAHQYIAAALNILAGADPSDVQEAFDDATDLFEIYTPEYIGSLKGNNPIRQEFLALSEMLDDYNNGICPGKCEESQGSVPQGTNNFH